jgi:hypothetical protein
LVQTFHETVTIRGGAIPQTFDGGATLNFNERASVLVGMKVSHSLSIHTTEEANGLCIRLQSSNWNGSRYFAAGFIQMAGPATNRSVEGVEPDFIALDIPVSSNSSMTIDVSTILGATQTGTNDVNIEFIYADGQLPADIVQSFIAAAGHVPAKGGSYAYYTALATTAEVALTGNATLLNIPQEAKEIIAVAAHEALDTAVTVSEELGSTIRVDYGLTDQGVKQYTTNGGVPNLGTEVDGGAIFKVTRTPSYIPMLPNRELQVRAYVTSLSACTGGKDGYINILWR